MFIAYFLTVYQVVPCFRELATHYPDRLSAVRVLNSPAAASFVYRALLAPLMSENTRRKVRIVDGKETPGLLRNELGRALESEVQGTGAFFNAQNYLAREF